MLLDQFNSLSSASLEFDRIHLEGIWKSGDKELNLNKIFKALKPAGSFEISGYCCDEQNKSILNATKLVFLLKLAGFKEISVEKEELTQDDQLDPELSDLNLPIKKFLLKATRGLQQQQKTVLNEKVKNSTGGSDDCELGNGGENKKKACKNCSCGRASLQSDSTDDASNTFKLVVNENNEIDTSQYKSNCGSCSLGDECRCAGCPFVGLPAFKPGEILKLDLTKIDK